MTEQDELSFAGLLRQLRTESQPRQEELAEAAQLSARSVSDLERGINRTARKGTALLLADALHLAGPVRVRRSSRPPVDAGPPQTCWPPGVPRCPGAFAASATRALPRDIVGFTGRQAEFARLMDTMDALAANGGVVGIHAIKGMAGIGKTTFAVHAAHRWPQRSRMDSFPAAARAHPRPAARRPGGRAGQLAADRTVPSH